MGSRYMASPHSYTTSSSADLRTPRGTRRSELTANSSSRLWPPLQITAAANGSSSLANVKTPRPGNAAALKKGQNLAAVLKKFFETRSKLKTGLENDTSGKSPGFSAIRGKLFGNVPVDRTALTEADPSVRTLAAVLRSERKLLSQNKEYEAEILELKMAVLEKNSEVEKMMDLCLKQREEIKALKEDMLLLHPMNSQLHHGFLEEQGLELKEAERVIPTLLNQMSSLTGQLRHIADDLAQVKAENCAGKSCFDGSMRFPTTPMYSEEQTSILQSSSAESRTPDDIFLKDLNPCLTP